MNSCGGCEIATANGKSCAKCEAGSILDNGECRQCRSYSAFLDQEGRFCSFARVAAAVIRRFAVLFAMRVLRPTIYARRLLTLIISFTCSHFVVRVPPYLQPRQLLCFIRDERLVREWCCPR